MGRKVHPKIFRIPIIGSWKSRWFSTKKMVPYLKQDIKVREFIKKRLKKTGIDRIEFERMADNFKVIIFTAKPGLIIGRGGADIETLKKDIKKKFLDRKTILEVAVQEVPQPSLAAQIVAEGIIADLERRVPYRRAMKRAIDQVKRGGAKGVKVMLSGRLDGVEIARKEKLSWGRMPLQTGRADIDYSQDIAHTTYGSVGVKVWIYRGEVFADKSAK